MMGGQTEILLDESRRSEAEDLNLFVDNLDGEDQKAFLAFVQGVLFAKGQTLTANEAVKVRI